MHVISLQYVFPYSVYLHGVEKKPGTNKICLKYANLVQTSQRNAVINWLLN